MHMCDKFYVCPTYDTNRRTRRLYESELGSLSCVSCNAIHAIAYAQMRKALSMFNNIRMYNGIEKRKSVKGK